MKDSTLYDRLLDDNGLFQKVRRLYPEDKYTTKVTHDQNEVELYKNGSVVARGYKEVERELNKLLYNKGAK